ncbi:hypothetical protein ABQE36_17135 [Enterococcus avium]|uniref:hypothetical protein n=1 Tax=Enterococcus avium TaxID=33945 RepID=UPI0032E381FE
MHILDVGTPYNNNLNDFFLHNRMAHSGLTQAVIQRVCLDQGIDWHEVDIMLALEVGTRILSELKQNNHITYTEKELVTIQKYEKQISSCKETVTANV